MREETVLSLKWHSFPSHLAVSLDTCYEKQQFVDLSLVCKDGTILKCHKMVLANSSSFFRRLLVANDHPHPMIILHDIEADDLKTIVNFMYCGEIQVVQSEVRRLLKLAEILEVTGLRHIQTSVLVGESNNTSQESQKKQATVSRIKIDETRSLSAKSNLDHEGSTRCQSKLSQSSRYGPASQKSIPKPTAQDSSRKNEEANINVLSQHLETGRSGISIVDINDMPSTSRGIPNPPHTKRKEPSSSLINWPRILSAISKDNQPPLKRLCIMDEVEITAGKPPTSMPETRRNEPLDRRKNQANIENRHAMKCQVFIKDEVDIPPEMEEDTDMDPLEVEDFENDGLDIIPTTQRYSFSRNIDQSSFNTGTHSDYPPRKGSNG